MWSFHIPMAFYIKTRKIPEIKALDKMKKFWNLLQFTSFVLSLVQVKGHGLISDPPSRGWFCGYLTKPDNYPSGPYPVCGDAFNAPYLNPNDAYNYMSVATHEGGFQVDGARDHVCSYNSDFALFVNHSIWVDAPIEWPKTNVSSSGGSTWFTWSIQWGPHFSDTKEFPDFVYTVGKNITFNDFESTPFCVQNYTDTTPTANPNVISDYTAVTFKVQCNVPARSGHHIIKAEWGRDQSTFERFHSCVDLNFIGASSSSSTTSSKSTATTTTTSKPTTTTTTTTTIATSSKSTTTTKASSSTATVTTTTKTSSLTSTSTSATSCIAKYGQ
ncbi:hypothetical protein HK096_000799, partial [Nowakowskiella sp. JEL0078]